MIVATPKQLKTFINKVESFYRKQGRDLPWRKTKDPYKILVSEFMLQQTQVGRVEGKYREFLAKYPDIGALAKAPLSDVLEVWSGLGYNRRARFLRELSRIVVTKYAGQIPHDRATLLSLPGVGQSTAGAIRAFAFNKPDIFIETNIRRAFIHYFAKEGTAISDKDLAPLITQTIRMVKSPRIWYWALMDYGSALVREVPNPNRKSLHYKKQSAFEGSNRQIRGTILRVLLEQKRASERELIAEVGRLPVVRVRKILNALLSEGLLTAQKSIYTLAK